MTKKLDAQAVVNIPISKLKRYDTNARTHSKKQIDQIAKSILHFGFLNPVLVTGENQIVAGHGRVEAAKAAGLENVPVLNVGAMSKSEIKAYVIADNRLAEQAGWDHELLVAEIEELGLIEDFDFDCIGFDQGELDALLSINEPVADEDDFELPKHDNIVSQPGDIWLLGKHKIACGDIRDANFVARVLATEKAQMVFTDPPYNVPINGHVCGLGAVKHREFAMASGEMSKAEFTRFLEGSMHSLASVSEDGSIHFICMDWRHLREILAAGDEVYSELKNVVVWNKDNGGMGAFYRSKHEFIFVFKCGKGPHVNNFGLGEKGRYRTNVWDYAGINSLKKGRAEELEMHPTVKPVAMVADAIRDCSKRGAIILDGFAGSGTTIIAAEQTGRRGYGIEIDPAYVDVAVKRWQKLTGRRAIHAETGAEFKSESEGIVH